MTKQSSSHQQKVEAGRKGGEARHASSQARINQSNSRNHNATSQAAKTRKAHNQESNKATHR